MFAPPQGWQHYACPCCLSVDFDAPPLPPSSLRGFAAQRRARRQPRRQRLQSQACSSAAAVQADDEPEEIAKQPRNVLARGMARFESGSTASPQPDWEELSPRVICVLGQNPSSFTLNGTNCYLVGTGRRRLLVDAAEKHYGADAFMASLKQCMEEHDVEGLDGVIITHFHHDHWGNVERLQDTYGPMPVYFKEPQRDPASLDVIAEVERRGLQHIFTGDNGEPLANPKIMDQWPTIPDTVDLSWAEIALRSFFGDNLGRKVQAAYFFAWTNRQFCTQLRDGVFKWIRIEDGARICTEGASLTALLTEGHALAHMSFLLEEEHAVFSGDNVLGFGTTLVSDVRDYMHTLQRMLDFRPSRLYPGHGPYIADAVDVLSRYIAHRQQRENQVWDILRAMERPMHARDIAAELYPDTPADRLWMAHDNVEKILRKFVKDGSVSSWLPASETGAAAESLVEAAPSSGYGSRRLEDDKLMWVAKCSLAAPAMAISAPRAAAVQRAKL
eukprot:TRINITY_DN38317_c0_g1_i2.p1 TRINITY_DN38317_c0_g1~~TRINITY_DN38317_c0_g1_i2.p1  ORF type:complete len:501 (-),score=98.19 TRINITY_DN38317_c0_g1_i2:68-1570(-)